MASLNLYRLLRVRGIPFPYKYQLRLAVHFLRTPLPRSFFRFRLSSRSSLAKEMQPFMQQFISQYAHVKETILLQIVEEVRQCYCQGFNNLMAFLKLAPKRRKQENKEA